jgi:O-antigen/teichoic acid export membrane protein
LYSPGAYRILDSESGCGEILTRSDGTFDYLGVWGVVNAVSYVMAILLNGTGVLKVLTIVAVFASLINLVLSIFLTRRLGVMGVCLGSIITQLGITLPACFVLVRKLFRRMARAKMENGLDEVIYLA